MSTPNNEEQEMFKAMYGLFPTKISVYEVRQVTETGFVSYINHNVGMEYILMAPAIVITGIVAAIAIPNIIKAKKKAEQKN